MTTRMSSFSCLMRLQASTPLPSGRRMSISTTSGVSWAAICTDSATEPASPTTRKPPVCESSDRRPSRTTWWSSTMSTRMGSVGLGVMC